MPSEQPIASSTDDSITPEVINEKEQRNPTATQEPASVEHEQEAWNSSTINIYRYIQALFAFIVLGVHDGSIGALIPYVRIIKTLFPLISILTSHSSRNTTKSPTPSSHASSSPLSPGTPSPPSSSTKSMCTSDNSASRSVLQSAKSLPTPSPVSRLPGPSSLSSSS